MRSKKSLRYPTIEQGKVWEKRREGSQPSDIADEMGVSRPYVSQAQRIAEERIEDLMKHTAKVLHTEIQHISTQYGIAVGYCHAFDTMVFITYSSAKGIQTWYNHKGDCGRCDKHEECEKIIDTLSEEWGVSLADSGTPSEKGSRLFNRIMEILGWDIEV
ncbi:MAG: hypothetical protein ACFFED_05010 [Candidatus Thorarchaeota archaeon]